MSKLNVWGYKGETRDKLPIRIVGDLESAKRDADDTFDQGRHTKVLVTDDDTGKVVYAREVEFGTYCTYCGALMARQDWPKKCPSCSLVMYQNPLPVVVTLVPVARHLDLHPGLLVVQRGIQPGLGQWALPGGYMNFREQWQEASVRETLEETGIQIVGPHRLLHAKTTEGGRLLLFSIAQAVRHEALDAFKPNDEVTAIKVIQGKRDLPLVFPLHTEAAAIFFSLDLIA